MIASMVAKYYRFLKEERFPNRMVNIELLLGNHRIWYDLYDFSPRSWMKSIASINFLRGVRGIRTDEKVVGIQRSRRETKIDRFQATERQRVSIQRARAPL